MGDFERQNPFDGTVALVPRETPSPWTGRDEISSALCCLCAVAENADLIVRGYDALGLLP